MAGYLRLVDLEDSYRRARRRRHTDPLRALVWVGLLGFLVAFWAGVALLVVAVTS